MTTKLKMFLAKLWMYGMFYESDNFKTKLKAEIKGFFKWDTIVLQKNVTSCVWKYSEFGKKKVAIPIWELTT